MAKELGELTLYDILPPPLQGDAETVKTAETIDPFLQHNAELADDLPILSRIDELDESWLDMLAWQWHADKYDLNLTVDEKREIVKRILLIHRYKGTLYAVKKALEPFEYDVEVDEYTGEHHLFDVSVEPLKDGADLAEVVERTIGYINSAKAATRHIRNLALSLNAEDINEYTGIAPHAGEIIRIYPTVYRAPEDAVAYAAAGTDYEVEITLEAE